MQDNDQIQQKATINFYQEVESLRGLAALAVVIEHCFWNIADIKPGVFDALYGIQRMAHWLLHVCFNGRASVLLFFIMSGFVLGLQLRAESLPLYKYWPIFIVRRILRIVPAMWISVILSYGVALLIHKPQNADLAMLVRTLFLWDFFLQSPLWSINIEMGCSLVFPVLYLISTRIGKIGNIALFCLFMMTIFIIPMPPWDLRVEFMRYLVLFHAGLLCGEYGSIGIAKLGRLRHVLFWFALFAFGVIPQLWIFQSTLFLHEDRRWMLLAEVPFCIFILAYIVYERGCSTIVILRAGWARFLGKISYSLFLFHFPILTIVHFAIFERMTISLAAVNQRYPILIQLSFFIVVLTISILIAAASYVWIEKPFIEVGRKVGRTFMRRGIEHVEVIQQA